MKTRLLRWAAGGVGACAFGWGAYELRGLLIVFGMWTILCVGISAAVASGHRIDDPEVRR